MENHLLSNCIVDIVKAGTGFGIASKHGIDVQRESCVQEPPPGDSSENEIVAIDGTNIKNYGTEHDEYLTADGYVSCCSGFRERKHQ